MWKMFILNGNYKWVDELPRLVSDYNACKHCTVGMRPVDVTLAIAEKLLDTVYSVIKIAGPAKFKVGDSVRVNKYKTVFEDGYTPLFFGPPRCLRLLRCSVTNPVTYLLEDYREKSVAGAFYEHELHRAIHPDVYFVEKILRRKGDRVLRVSAAALTEVTAYAAFDEHDHINVGEQLKSYSRMFSMASHV
ncbi:PREDICTED: uncharacterized protein LOC108761573 [Trachymyrmex cornetzi]|uniref:uncharacterized protein LOC108761573 n=1 Tax=Trachymyrmex cornetzi TaxID=471704 RepID=UPI00084F8295|nr:PREDICTED: uncharacterized protein LOC108761573 [Trachymyrmex cornetzi]